MDGRRQSPLYSDDEGDQLTNDYGYHHTSPAPTYHMTSDAPTASDPSYLPYQHTSTPSGSWEAGLVSAGPPAAASSSSRPAAPKAVPKTKRRKSVSTRKPSFIEKLYRILRDPSLSRLIHWDDAGTSLMIFHPTELILLLHDREIFNSNKVSSFTRQLNIYGFKKMVIIPSSNSSSEERQRMKEMMQWRHDYLDRDSTQADITAVVRKVPRVVVDTATPSSQAQDQDSNSYAPSPNFQPSRPQQISSPVQSSASSESHSASASYPPSTSVNFGVPLHPPPPEDSLQFDADRHPFSFTSSTTTTASTHLTRDGSYSSGSSYDSFPEMHESYDSFSAASYDTGPGVWKRWNEQTIDTRQYQHQTSSYSYPPSSSRLVNQPALALPPLLYSQPSSYPPYPRSTSHASPYQPQSQQQHQQNRPRAATSSFHPSEISSAFAPTSDQVPPAAHPPASRSYTYPVPQASHSSLLSPYPVAQTSQPPSLAETLSSAATQVYPSSAYSSDLSLASQSYANYTYSAFPPPIRPQPTSGLSYPQLPDATSDQLGAIHRRAQEASERMSPGVGGPASSGWTPGASYEIEEDGLHDERR